MLLNIITPCSRPSNLETIEHSINIPKSNYKWFIVFDANSVPNNIYLPKNAEIFAIKNNRSTVGHAQRNLALDIIDNGHIYMNDDDTILHPQLWDNIKELDHDFISFMQTKKDGRIRIYGDKIKVGTIDSHNFIVSKNISRGIYWKIDRYEADGLFAVECYKKAKTKIYIPKVLSIYNYLRT
jgi:hypothetical protein